MSLTAPEPDAARARDSRADEGRAAGASITTAAPARPRAWAAAALALVGLADASYLTIEHLSGRSVRCVVVSGCDQVLMSPYAELWGGVPLAALGALAYFAAFSLAVLAAFGHASAWRLLAPLVALMFVFTLWLLYVQAFRIKAFCAYCLLSAAVTTALALVVFVPPLSRRRPS